MSNDVYGAALGVFRHFGFTLHEEDDHTVVLEHAGEVVDRFTIDAPILAVRGSCKYHLVREHGAEESVLYKDA